MLIYEIPCYVEDSAKTLREFLESITTIDESLTNLCFFKIIPSDDVPEINKDTSISEVYYLIIPNNYKPHFSFLLSKYEAKELNKVPDFSKAIPFAGNLEAIIKMF
jgi:hypothetical protein